MGHLYFVRIPDVFLLFSLVDSILGKVTIAMIFHHDQKPLEEESVYLAYTSAL